MLSRLAPFFFVLAAECGAWAQSDCTDSLAIAQLLEQWRRAPELYWSQQLRASDDSKIAFYLKQLPYLERKLPIARRPARNELSLRIWKWSEWHYAGALSEWRRLKGDKRWLGLHYAFNDYPHFTYRKVRSKAASEQIDSLMKINPLAFFPQQPWNSYHCPPRQTLYVYIVEIWVQGEYRRLCYQDPERYAEQGSCIDRLFLEIVRGLGL